MKLNPLRRSKALLGLALVASSVAAVVPLSTVAQAAPGDAPAGPATISPASGPLTGTFTLSLPVGASCPGDGPAGYRWGTYITPITNDVGGMVFDGLGSPSGQPAFTSSLRQSPGGGFLRGQTPGLTNGLIPVPIPTLQWLGVAPPAGEYNIGIACTLNDGTAIVNTRFWNAQITVAEPTPGNFTFATGVAPAAPVLTAGVGTASTQTINIAQTGTVDSYSLSVTPPLPSLPTVAPGATSFELTGLTLGQSYDVVLTANKSGFPGAASNTLSFTAAATGTIAVEAPNAFEGTDATISWSAPTFAPGVTAPAPLSYDVAISGGPSFTGVVGLSQAVPGLALGTYTATVTANYAPGAGVAASGSAPFTVNPNALIYQDITVERPQGALVLTQRCGVFGGFPAFDTSGWPGAGLTLDPVAAVGGAGTAPVVVGGPNDGLADPLFTSYPQRGSYPTLCGVNLGAGELATDGPFAGRFFVADGSINQVTVLDTRDGDLGWNAKGDIADLFTTGSGPFDENNSFTGDFLGWFPQVTSTSTGQTVTAGDPVGPGTVNAPTVVGMTGNPTLASAPAGAGLGIATLDARLALLIPVAADAGTYTARLSLTVA